MCTQPTVRLPIQKKYVPDAFREHDTAVPTALAREDEHRVGYVALPDTLNEDARYGLAMAPVVEGGRPLTSRDPFDNGLRSSNCVGRDAR
jgi:hypothetical protein